MVIAAAEEERSKAGGGAERGNSVALAQQHVEPEAGVARRPSATSDRRGRPANAMDGPWIRSWVDGRVRGASGAGPRATAGGRPRAGGERRCAAARGGRADQSK